MPTKSWLWTGIICAAALFGCEEKVTAGFTVSELQDSWVLSKIDGKDIAITEPRNPPGMQIDTNLKVTGFSGCNRFFGQVELTDKSKFRITAMGTTKMACIQNELATIESTMTKSLQKWNSIALENNILTLTSEQHILTFTPGELSVPDSPQ